MRINGQFDSTFSKHFLIDFNRFSSVDCFIDYPLQPKKLIFFQMTFDSQILIRISSFLIQHDIVP